MHIPIKDLPEREPDTHPEATFTPYVETVPTPESIWTTVIQYETQARANGQTKTAKDIFILGADLVLLLKSVDLPKP